jgi:hypothetical protein
VTTGTGSGSDASADAGVSPNQCPAGGELQGSGTNNPSDPTPFQTVACGTLSSGQSYFWTFHLPPSATKLGIAFTDGVHIQLSLDGMTFDVVPGANIPFRTRDPYLLQVSPSGNETESYVITVTEK